MKASTLQSISPRPFVSQYANERPRYRVLLVEDNPAEAELVSESLSNSVLGGFDIVHVVSMLEASRALAADRFDCIILDLQLPDSSGVDTVRAMRASAGGAPIVAYSGLDDDRSRAAALDEGAHDFISKNAYETGALNRGILYAVERWRAIKLHQQFEGLFAANPEAMVIMDLAGVPIFANEAASQLFKADTTSLDQRLASYVEKCETCETWFSRDGEDRIGEVRTFACEWDGAPATLAVIRDVTEERNVALKLRRARKLEAIGRFAGGLAHNFGNVLSCIDVFVDLARASPGDERANEDYLNGIRRAVQSGKDILKQLVSLEQSGARAADLTNVGTVLDEMRNFLALALPSNIVLRIDRELEVWPVLIDRGQFEQVIINLALNARDAMPSGGRLHIACTNAPGAASNLDRVVVRVSDTGPGVPAENAKKIFDLFFTTKPSGKGTGLGLAMCQSIIEQAGGALALAPDYVEGASFEISLPRAGQSRNVAVSAPSLTT